MKPVLVFGAGQVAEVFSAYLIENDFKVASFVVDPDYWSDAINGIPVYSTLGMERIRLRHRHELQGPE
jgi:hypothetical protein